MQVSDPGLQGGKSWSKGSVVGKRPQGVGHSFGEVVWSSQIGETRERSPRAPYTATDDHVSRMVIRTAQRFLVSSLNQWAGGRMTKAPDCNSGARVKRWWFKSIPAHQAFSERRC